MRAPNFAAIVAEHKAADAACGRPWQCACGPCCEARGQKTAHGGPRPNAGRPPLPGGAVAITTRLPAEIAARYETEAAARGVRASTVLREVVTEHAPKPPSAG